MKRALLSILLALNILSSYAQDQSKQNSRALTMNEYLKAKTYTIKDLDNDTYAKFDNNYILDRYEMRKPYFITGDDGLKKRIDLYNLITKEGMQPLGTMIFYTDEKGKLYTALQPGFTADSKVWEKYFEDIHAIDKEEKNFVLKLSYVLSKEMSFQLFKAMSNGKDMKDELATYGTDICFPGDEEVVMSDGSKKQISEIKAGDNIVTVDPVTKKSTAVTVSKLIQHEAKNYAITSLLIVAAEEKLLTTGKEIKLSSKILSATPNHPITTINNIKKMGDIKIGDEVICMNEKTHAYQTYKVYNKTEAGNGVQKVYNMEVNAGSTYIMNGVIVVQK